MTIVYHILFLIFLLAIIFCIFSIGYYSGRAREFNIRQRAMTLKNRFQIAQENG